jgi:L-threonylcarbamoyladenylate synthase
MCLQRAVDFIRKGRVVSFPTETFYALGVRHDNEDSLRRVVEVKKRSGSKAFSLIIGDVSELSLLVRDIDPLTQKIIDKLWPSALTIIFRAKEGLSRYVTDERGTIAVRMPARSFALELARMVKLPLTATSANASGMPPARSSADVAAYFHEGIDLLIDGGESRAAYPSTIIEVVGGEITVLREGVIRRSEIYSVLAQ